MATVQRLVCIVALGLMGVVPAVVQGQQAKPQQKRNSREATEADYRALAQQSEVVGRLLSVDATTDSRGGTQQLTLAVDFTSWELKPGASLQTAQAQRQMQHLLRNQQQLQREYQQILRIRNPIQQQQRLLQLFARLQMQPAGNPTPNFNPRNSPFRPVTQTVTFELPVQPKARVARAKPPTEYDDKGNIVQLKPEELKKRKDPEMPGYKANWEDLLPGEIVKVYLARPQTKKKDSDKKDADKDAQATPKKAIELPELKSNDQKATETASSDYRPEARLILILDDSAATTPPAPKADKKKN